MRSYTIYTSSSFNLVVYIISLNINKPQFKKIHLTMDIFIVSVWTIVHSATRNILVHNFWCPYICTSVDVYLGVEELNHGVYKSSSVDTTNKSDSLK